MKAELYSKISSYIFIVLMVVTAVVLVMFYGVGYDNQSAVTGGAYVTDGKVNRGSLVRVVRDGIVIHEGELGSLKRFKDDVKEVATGYECGLVFEKFNDLQEFDQVELYMMVEVPRK